MTPIISKIILYWCLKSAQREWPLAPQEWHETYQTVVQAVAQTKNKIKWDLAQIPCKAWQAPVKWVKAAWVREWLTKATVRATVRAMASRACRITRTQESQEQGIQEPAWERCQSTSKENYIQQRHLTRTKRRYQWCRRWRKSLPIMGDIMGRNDFLKSQWSFTAICGF